MQKKLALFVALLIAFIDFMGVGLVYPMFSSMLFSREVEMLPAASSEAMRGFWLGILLATMPLFQFFSAPLLGTISDRVGRKKILKISLFVAIFGYLIAAFAVWNQSFVLLLFSRVVIGVSAGSSAVVAAVLADLSRPEEKTKNFGLLNMAFGVGFTVGPFLGGKLSDPSFLVWGGFETPFLFAGILSFINLVMLFLFFKETNRSPRKSELSWGQGFSNLKKAFYLRKLRTVLLSFFILCFGWSFFWEFIPVNWIEEHGLSPSQIGNLYAYGAAFFALSSGFLIRPIVTRFEPIKVLFWALIILGFYTLILLIESKPDFLWFFIPFQQFLVALLFPTAAALVSNSVSEEMQGEVMGIFQSLESFGFVTSPLVSGVFVGLSHSMPIVVGGCAMLLAGAVLGGTLFRNRLQ